MWSRPSSLPGLLLAALSLSAAACWLDLDRLGADLPSAAAGGGAPGASVLACDPCPEGGCAPVVVAEGTAFALGVVDLVVADDGLSWVNQEGGEVVRFAADAALPEVITGAVAPRSVVVREGEVFYTDDEGLWSCVADTCLETRKKISSPAAQGTLGRVVFDGASVYWTDRGAGEGEGHVYGCDPASCAAPKEHASKLLRPDTILASGGELFWVDLGNGNQNGTIFQSAPGGNATPIAGALVFPTSLAVDNDSFYYPAWAPDGTVARCPKGAYCHEPVAVTPVVGGGKPFDVAVSGGRVYWTDTAAGEIRSCPAAGCAGEAPRVHASGRTGLSRLVLGKQCIFWLDQANGGSVMKVGR
ncbi:hypothetical protein [Polyangium spumosum]|uniref:Uncharacterized protein n=1 Tax=Polyangium spumosum TaxID=889282 RepID=A0A6N7PIR1_9BACT|nr:hypothetical protein [Polyangium spumosum]MRG92002.1 hypothetical protein [Polyangium spumosum]